MRGCGCVAVGNATDGSGTVPAGNRAAAFTVMVSQWRDNFTDASRVFRTHALALNGDYAA